MKKSILILLTIVALLVAPMALATTVLRVGVPELTTTSEWVVRAQVEDVRSIDLRHEGRSFFTDVELLITEVYRGQEVPSRYTLRLIGGRGSDGLQLWIPGMPRFQKGEEAVLFLEKTSMGHIPTGLGQGVWRVHTDKAGNAWVRESLGGMHLVERGAHGRLKGAAIPLLTPMRSLDDLIDEVYAVQQLKSQP